MLQDRSEYWSNDVSDIRGLKLAAAGCLSAGVSPPLSSTQYVPLSRL